VTYRTRDELHALIDRFLGDPDERSRRAAMGREIVLASHTFSHAADALLAEIESLRPGRALPLPGTVAEVHAPTA
jgi:spore maturation protein CgeB